MEEDCECGGGGSVSRKANIKKSDLRRMYEDEGMSQQEIANWYDVNNATISNRTKEFGIKARFRYSVNEDFFKEWTKESSWLYGWFVGDGYILEERRLGFNLARKDKEVLYKFKKVMESEHPVKDRIVRFGEMSYLYIGTIEMVKDLRKLSYEDVPDWHRSDLTRGFFEAEGSVFLNIDKRRNDDEHIQTNFAQKDTTILKWIWKVLRDEEVVEGGYLGWSHLVFGESDSVSLYHYLYDDRGDLYLERKKNRFEELMGGKGYL